MRAQVVDQRPQLRADLRVQTDGRLVEQDQLRLVDEAARHAGWRCAAEEDLRGYVLLGKLCLGRLPAGRPPDVDAMMVPERHGLVRIVTRRFVRRTRRHGIGVFVWTVNEPGDMRRLLALGVDGLISDFPGRARRIVDEGESLADEGGGGAGVDEDVSGAGTAK